MTDTTTIAINDSALPGQLGAAVRQILLAAGGWAIGRGYLNTDTLNAILTIALVAGPVVYGQWKRYQDHQNARSLAIAAPNGTLK